MTPDYTPQKKEILTVAKPKKDKSDLQAEESKHHA